MLEKHILKTLFTALFLPAIAQAQTGPVVITSPSMQPPVLLGRLNPLGATQNPLSAGQQTPPKEQSPSLQPSFSSRDLPAPNGDAKSFCDQGTPGCINALSPQPGQPLVEPPSMAPEHVPPGPMENILDDSPRPSNKQTVQQDNGNSRQSCTQTRIFFAVGSSHLNQQARQTLSSLAGHKAKHFVLLGYTDSTGSLRFNERLAKQRINATEKFLLSRGVDPADIYTHALPKQNYRVDPKLCNDSSSCQADNRRVTVIACDASLSHRDRAGFPRSNPWHR